MISYKINTQRIG